MRRSRSDYMGSIIWRKKTTMNTSGGATIMGSYPYPPNGIVEIDFEYILLFRKPGAPRTVEKSLKVSAAMTRDEWKSWFSGHWELGGARKKGHEAPFPDEIPRRLIRMFSFPGDTVLDPFLGTGTTAAVALDTGRNAIGYEINPAFVEIAREKLGEWGAAVTVTKAMKRLPAELSSLPAPWQPRIPDLAPAQGGPPPKQLPPLSTVVDVGQDCSLLLDTGMRVYFLGLRIDDPAGALAYLRQRVLKKKVFLTDAAPASGTVVHARVVLKNRISINSHLVKAGLATALA
jgi:modification methylase